MAYDINSALERLEKNLKDIDSARKQVEQTIESSNSLQAVVANYVSSLDSLQANVKNLIEDISSYQRVKSSEFNESITAMKSSCDTIVELFEGKLNSSSEKLKSGMTDTLGTFVAENSKLAGHVSELAALKESLNTATAEVKEVEKKLDKISADINKSQQDQDKVLESIKASIELVKTQIDSSKTDVIKKGDSVIAAIGDTKTSIKADLDDVHRFVEMSKDIIKKNMNLNRWILIGGLIVLAILHFI